MSANSEPPRLDELVRTERYFTAMLLPTILLHNEFDGARQFVELLDKKARTEWVVDDPSVSCIPPTAAAAHAKL
jgi:hypothetical protein